jgi:hypothetical protein
MSCFHSLSSSLRLGLPLPALYTPLMEEFHSFTKFRFEVSLEPHADLPKVVDATTLGMKDYQSFSVAITVSLAPTSFWTSETCTQSAMAVVNRLDKLTYVVKTLVGESFHCVLDVDVATKSPVHNLEQSSTP